MTVTSNQNIMDHQVAVSKRDTMWNLAYLIRNDTSFVECMRCLQKVMRGRAYEEVVQAILAGKGPHYVFWDANTSNRCSDGRTDMLIERWDPLTHSGHTFLQHEQPWIFIIDVELFKRILELKTR